MKSHNNKPTYRRILLIAAISVAGLCVFLMHNKVTAFFRDNILPAKPLLGTVVTPSVDSSNFYSTEAYGGPDAPWGFYHNGVDFIESKDHQPIQAAADGKIVRLEERYNEGSKWQVELTIKHGKYDLQYAFEIFSGDKKNIDAQMSDITVKLGQYVNKGQIVGYLHRKDEGAHVHFGIAQNNQTICPEPFFTDESKTAVLALIRKTYPKAQMCYPADPTAPRKVPENQSTGPATNINRSFP